MPNANKICKVIPGGYFMFPQCGLFKRKINWNLSYFDNPVDGMILQRVVRKSNNVNLKIKQQQPYIFDDDYFEYWLIDSGTVQGDEPHDTWSYMSSNIVDDIVSKQGTQGNLNMTGKVYFIPSDIEIYSQIKTEFNCHFSAIDLPAISTDNYIKKSSESLLPCIDSLQCFYRGEQTPINANWDFNDDNDIVYAIVKLFKDKQYDYLNQFNGLRNLKNYDTIKSKILNELSRFL